MYTRLLKWKNVSRKKYFFICQLHFCCLINTVLLFTAGYASMSLTVFPPDTLILSFLCFMTVLQTPTSRLSQDINYWWEIDIVALKLLSTLKRSSSIIGLLNCFFDSVAVSSWRTERVDYCWQAHNQACLTLVPTHDRREMAVDTAAD